MKQSHFTCNLPSKYIGVIHAVDPTGPKGSWNLAKLCYGVLTASYLVRWSHMRGGTLPNYRTVISTLSAEFQMHWSCIIVKWRSFRFRMSLKLLIITTHWLIIYIKITRRDKSIMVQPSFCWWKFTFKTSLWHHFKFMSFLTAVMSTPSIT